MIIDHVILSLLTSEQTCLYRTVVSTVEMNHSLHQNHLLSHKRDVSVLNEEENSIEQIKRRIKQLYLALPIIVLSGF
jgi:hypothetical protein